jgi:tRNA pseudouridine55 synthase
MATGVLVLCLGRATRLIPYLEEDGGSAAKEYEAEIRFGFETTTDDAEGDRRSTDDAPVPDAGQVRSALAAFVGDLEQVPPGFSAKKVNGERAYDLARRGEDARLKPVKVEVATAELLSFELDRARVRFEVSRGTYIRALARDLGRALGSAAHLTALRRTRSGSSVLAAALPADELDEEGVAARLLPMADVLSRWPAQPVDEAGGVELRLGRSIESDGILVEGTRVRLIGPEGELVALARARNRRFEPFCVF